MEEAMAKKVIDKFDPDYRPSAEEVDRVRRHGMTLDDSRAAFSRASKRRFNFPKIFPKRHQPNPGASSSGVRQEEVADVMQSLVKDSPDDGYKVPDELKLKS